jgi:hypothetical protein
MLMKITAVAAAALALAAGSARADTFTQSPSFIPSYVGPMNGDLEVTSFSANYDVAAADFTLSATLNGMIGTTADAQYVIGVDTGTGKTAPFASIGEANVKFDQVFVVAPNGSVSGGSGLTATISGDKFSLVVPQSDITSTGFAPTSYAFNLWPKDGAPLTAISDFAPRDALLGVSAAPEPGSWLLMIAGVSLTGMMMRRRQIGFARA